MGTVTKVLKGEAGTLTTEKLDAWEIYALEFGVEAGIKSGAINKETGEILLEKLKKTRSVTISHFEGNALKYAVGF